MTKHSHTQATRLGMAAASIIAADLFRQPFHPLTLLPPTADVSSVAAVWLCTPARSSTCGHERRQRHAPFRTVWVAHGGSTLARSARPAARHASTWAQHFQGKIEAAPRGRS